MTRIIGSAITVLVLSAILGLSGGDAGTAGPGLFIGSAEAKVGRPLTPVSVAGVGRRTVRRCAAGVYDC